MRSALFLSIPLVLSSAACTYDNGDARRVSNPPPASTCSSTAPAVQTAIDTDAQLQVEPGQGAGLFVEYGAGGHWTIRTTCDTSLKDNPACPWDVIVTPEDGRSISNVAGLELESSTDSIAAYPDDPRSYNLIAQTAGDIDGFTFDTEPGTAISVDSFLDGTCALSYFYWSGDGALHTGSPTNPLVLIPSAE